MERCNSEEAVPDKFNLEDEPIKPAIDAEPKEDASYQDRLKLIEAFGTFDFDPAYDYKWERWARKR